MKVLVYTGKVTTPGGITNASSSLIKALNQVGIETTTDPNDSYDIVDINFFQGAKRLIKRCRKKNIPVVVHAHSNEADFKYSFRFWQIAGKVWFYPSMWYMYEHADLVIPVSNFCKHHIESRLFHLNIPMQIVNNAIDIKAFAENIKAKNEFYNKFNLSEKDKIVLGLGLQINRKGIKDFIEVARRMPNIKFIWLGGQSKLLTEPNVSKALKKKPDNLYLTKFIQGDIWLGALQASDCIFFPTYCENDSLVALEALVNKTPLVTRNIGAFDYLEDGVTALKGNNIDDFVNKINYVLSHDCSEMVQNGYTYIKKYRDLNVIGNELKTIYQKLLKQKQ